jgi:hypothetical protein
MDFQQLLAKMVELDQPAQEGNEFSGALAKAKAAGQDEFEVDGKKYQVKEDGTVEECPMSPSPMNMDKPDTPPPSMSVNLNAQGMDDIAELMKLMTKVNPDMINQPDGGMPPMPSMGMEPSITAMPPLKMLPDLDADNNEMPGGEKDMDQPAGLGASLDRDGDGDHDMDDHGMEKKKDKEEAFANSLDDSDPETMDIDAAIRDGNDLHKKKSMHKAAAGGDNAMAAESTDLRSQIRAELQQRLAEAKGAK